MFQKNTKNNLALIKCYPCLIKCYLLYENIILLKNNILTLLFRLIFTT